MKKGLLLINLGSPDSTRVSDVRSYLKEFLSDPDVIDLPALGRNLLLYGVIIPFRPAKSAEAYRTIWTEDGSPLIHHTRLLTREVQSRVPDLDVKMAMRYGNPSIESAILEFRRQGVERIHAVALYPQYSTASMGSSYKQLMRVNENLQDPLFLSTEPAFYNNEGFLNAWVEIIRETMQPETHVLFSFHGIPERQVLKSSQDASCQIGECCDTQTPSFCYRAQCLHTAREVARRLQLPEDSWEVTFQSRLGRTPWLKPYTDLRLQELPGEGKKKITIVSPSFVADCLETLEELNIRGREDFMAAGGEEFTFVPSLNENRTWIQTVVQMARTTLD
ncbi:MAG: ferrochelatase [Spirochaetaceae bacterium]|nr:ferrochelatase [Spirochaetaceae bacterium]|tara:strand:+ start:67740 stop:68741 length:1002 start_codon:yes stop_codon:yes gene_type:complete